VQVRFRRLVCWALAGCALLSSVAWAGGWKAVESTTSPSPRFGHTMVNVGGKVYLFGGAGERHSPEDLFNDLWGYEDGLPWQEITPNNPPPSPRKGHQGVEHEGKMYVIFGMAEEGFLNDVWVYDPATKVWVQVPKVGLWPEGRRFHAATSCAGSIWLLGGFGSGGPLNDFWAFDPSEGTWEKKADFPGGGVYGASLSCAGEIILAYGGDPEGRGGLWAYKIGEDRWTYKEIEGAPPPRRCHAAVTVRDGLLISGGFGPEGLLGDSWYLSFEDLSWRELDPLPLKLGCMAMAPLGPSKVVLFGGVTVAEKGFQLWGGTMVYEIP